MPSNTDRRLIAAEQAVDVLDNRIRLGWREQRNKSVQAACGVVRLVAEFVVRSARSVEEDNILATAVRRDKAFVDAFTIIHPTVTDFADCLDTMGEIGVEDHLVEKLARLADDLRQQLDRAVGAFIAVVNSRTADDKRLESIRDKAAEVAGYIRSRLQVRQLVQETEQARDETVRLRDETKEAAGDAGANIFGAYYAEYADRETGAADWLRKIVAVLLAIVTAGAVYISVWLHGGSFSTELIRLSATVPFAVLAGYLARESSRHRKSARWAREMAIAMKTLPIYTEPLGTNGLALRLALGMRAFARSADQSGTTNEDGLFDDLPKVLDKLDEILNRVREATERQTKNQ